LATLEDEMNKRKIAGWVLALVIGAAVLPALSQQDEGPILRPRVQPAKPASPTLLVFCDLACNWKLDGESKGRIEEDGLDMVENETEIKTAGQTIMHLALQSVRDARVKADQEARDKVEREARERTAQEVRDKAAREHQEKEERERERIAQEEAAGVWTDPATGLMWAKEDNGRLVNWQEAMDYCQGLQLAGHAGWRLPTIGEFKEIFDPKLSYDPNVNTNGYHLKGNIEEGAKTEWSSSQANYPGEKWVFYSYSGKHNASRVDETDSYALCVRRPGEQDTREMTAREEAAKPTWNDPSTGLMWTKKDNGSDLKWQQAIDYCRNLRLVGHVDWRLPTIDELEGIFDRNAYEAIPGTNDFGQGYHVKGNLQLSGWQWSSSSGNTSAQASRFTFTGERHSFRRSDAKALRALCVRRSGE
jgi:hypothetical protein